MDDWVVLILAVLAVLILGGFSAAFLPAFLSNRFWMGSKEEDSIEYKAAHLHELVHPSDVATEDAEPPKSGPGE